MKLASYLEQHKLSASEFGRRIGVKHSTVLRYASGERTPRPDVMAEIVRATHGAVQPNDFYEPVRAA